MRITTHMTITAPEPITTAYELTGTTPIGNWTDEPCYYVDTAPAKCPTGIVKVCSIAISDYRGEVDRV